MEDLRPAVGSTSTSIWEIQWRLEVMVDSLAIGISSSNTEEERDQGAKGQRKKWVRFSGQSDSAVNAGKGLGVSKTLLFFSAISVIGPQQTKLSMAG
jgi:hypothetical protein